MLDQIKRISKQTAEAGSPTAWFFGLVTATEPLTIRVDNRFDIGEAQLVVMRQFRAGEYQTHTHTINAHSHTIDPHTHKVPAHATQTAGDGPHSHGVDPVETGQTPLTSNDTPLTSNPEVYFGLAVGDKVVLLRNAGGQQFLILGRV